MDLIGGYGEMSSDDSPQQEPSEAPSSIVDLKSKLRINAAPAVAQELKIQRVVDHTKTQVFRNPTYQEMWQPTAGPQAPWTGNALVPGQRNNLAGFVEDAGYNDFAFDVQHHAFLNQGVALDPTTGQYIVKQPHQTKKRKAPEESTAPTAEGDAAVEGTETPVAAAVKDDNEEYESDSDEGRGHRGGEPASKKAKVSAYEATSVFHGGERVDYMGRSWMEPPSHLKPDPDHVCYIPKKLLHTWAGHSKGVSTIKFFPQYGHYILSASMDSTVKIWEVYGKRRCMQTYNAHKLAVRDVDFSADGRRFVSVSYDKFARMFDTETGKCIANLSSGKTPVCVKMYPLDDNQFLVGQKNKKIYQWDIRQQEFVQEYDRHLDQINTLTFIDQGRRFVSTSDDKSVRVWDYGVGVDIKYIADPAMHAIPAAALSPDGQWLLGQSMDNKIVTFTAGESERFKINNKKTFKGHNVAGYACRPDVSSDGRYVASGTGDGGLVFWDWKTSRIFKRLKAHSAVTIAVAWHPIEGSKVATCSWDGTIKFWD